MFKTLHRTVIDKAAAIKLVIFDVDGVLTDGSIILANSGQELKMFNVQDGQGIHWLNQVGILTAIITKRTSKVVEYRADELKIPYVFQGQNNKLDTYETLRAKLCLSPAQVAYMGDDLPDLPIIKRVGLGTTVFNAPLIIREQALWTSLHKGGHGAVRELCELILYAQGKWDSIITSYDS